MSVLGQCEWHEDSSDKLTSLVGRPATAHAYVQLGGSCNARETMKSGKDSENDKINRPIFRGNDTNCGSVPRTPLSPMRQSYTLRSSGRPIACARANKNRATTHEARCADKVAECCLALGEG